MTDILISKTVNAFSGKCQSRVCVSGQPVVADTIDHKFVEQYARQLFHSIPAPVRLCVWNGEQETIVATRMS